MIQVPYVPEGLEAIIFTADGDMRQALNNLQVMLSGMPAHAAASCNTSVVYPVMLRTVLCLRMNQGYRL